MPHEIDGEPAYPIYSVRLRFHHAISDPEKVKDYGPRWFEGLPARRMWNGTSIERMYREEQTVEAILAELGPPNLTRFKEQYPDLDGWEGSVKGPRFETWCITWFCHQTFDNGQDDLAVLASFERFVNRTQRKIDEGDTSLCLMGAEERWRWRGENPGDPAPCRCSGCQKNGMIRINH